MTRTQFMKDAKSNIKLRLIGGKNYEWIKIKRPQNLEPRRIVKVQTNAIFLEGSENNGEGSYLAIPPASLVEYDGETLNIYNAAVREMTEEEVLNTIKANAEMERYEKENPHSDSFWHMKQWYKNCSTPWIKSYGETIKGKSPAQGSDYGKIIDNAIKGELILQYAIER